MKINGKEYSVDELVEQEHFSFLKKTKGGLMLNDNEVSILQRYGIRYENYSKLSDLVFAIETLIHESYGEDIEDLMQLSEDLAERSYYQETRK